jgi:hypothetical protein
MNVDWTSVLQSVGTFAVASGALAWLVKTLVSQGLSKDLEAFKASLARETERFKAELEAVEFEHRTKFSKLHDRVEAAVIDLNDKFFDAARSVHRLSLSVGFAGDPPRAEMLAAAQRRVAEAADACRKHGLFFSPEVDNQLNAAFESILAAARLHEVLSEMPFTPGEPTSAGHVRKKTHDDAAVIVRDQVWPAMKQLRGEFRRLLGVQSTDEPLAMDGERKS